MHDTLHTRSVCPIVSERERHNVTKTETYPSASGWHDPSLRACWCVPACMEAFFETRLFDHYHQALGRDFFR
jgi:hypothetical protein